MTVKHVILDSANEIVGDGETVAEAWESAEETVRDEVEYTVGEQFYAFSYTGESRQLHKGLE